MLNISLADYRVGNLHSLKKSLENCGAKVTVVTDMKDLLDAECLAFPGVGAFDKTMEALLPYKEEICKKLESGVPGIGICIGTQILTGGSEEGTSPGLGFIDGNTVRLKAKQVPHMGWNMVDTDDALMDGIENRHFYFAHSYYCEPNDASMIRGTTEYEGIRIPTMFRKKNFVGTQFHPEKSSTSGLRFISNFVRFAEECL
ncbi:MAG: imidazole glycerol phosphate synthase subunit HisH [Candidatus Methanomethylophilaceae archaeon]|nr:imidazole glycerol phosphate synthase subunit HisH [Candidatus Methanomethylophilaceae archaeon]MDY5873098.1 imidazole glycerol phosphate synthase subunit HisH [Candidatus Methanomethylophilaceae archaeon]